ATSNIIGMLGNGLNDSIQGNVISGAPFSFGQNVLIDGSGTSGNRLSGNLIGTTASGTSAFNDVYGVRILSGATNNIVGTNGTDTNAAAEGNVISGDYIGVQILGGTTTGNVVGGNVMGEDINGNALPNTFGVYIASGANNNTVGVKSGSANDAAMK